ncbi:hypothetical protein BDV93DRAFT_551506 [Ceratobasidium sp. AG-I]|nr:hypothetical protein BDV93DRAFT_551506 [Ceratobasidium sp. AG-I]
MTRYTNAGRKRTYLEAGFNHESEVVEETRNFASSSTGSKEKRRRGDEGKRSKDDLDRKFSSESRRLRRIDEKQSNTICFACREKGHAAKDCPAANSDLPGDGDELPQKALVGVCYRYTPTCPKLFIYLMIVSSKPENPKNPLPHASCFVCKQKGHLASACPKNAGRGIYPNGGSCKLCGQTDHLAKHCQLRKPEATQEPIYFGGDHTGGADEDDFHTLERRRADVDQEERSEQYQARAAKREIKAAPTPSLVNGVQVKRPTAKPKVVAF